MRLFISYFIFRNMSSMFLGYIIVVICMVDLSVSRYILYTDIRCLGYTIDLLPLSISIDYIIMALKYVYVARSAMPLYKSSGSSDLEIMIDTM